MRKGGVVLAGLAGLALVLSVSGWWYKNSTAPESDFKLEDGYSVVIAGDSLTFNAFEFDSFEPLAPADYAYKNPYGLASWGHMTRDTLYSSADGFRLGDTLSYEVTKGVTPHRNVNGLYGSPFNGRMRTYLVPNKDSVITIKGVGGDHPGVARLMFFTGASDFTNIAKFDIYSNGVYRRTVSLKGDDNFYRGRYQLNVDGIPVDAGGSVVIKNIVPASNDGSPAAVQIVGVSLTQPSVHMTGHGMWTSQQVLDDFDNMVGQYKPDLVFYQIGATDIGLNIPVATFKANLELFVQKVRALKPSAKIVLITATPSKYHPNRTDAAGYLNAAQQVSQQYDCKLVDLYELLSGLDPAKWRHDDVHASIEGGQLIYDEIRKKAFPGVKLGSGYKPDARYQVDREPR